MLGARASKPVAALPGVERLASPRSSIPLRVSDPPLRRVALPGSRGAGAFRLAGGPGASSSSGGAPLVVAIHGAPGSGFDFRYLSAELELRGPVLRIDVPGHGASARPASAAPAAASADSLATLTWALIDAARAEAAPEGAAGGGGGGAPVVLLAHSLGAELALRLAAQRPSAVAGVALVAPVGVSPHVSARPVRLVAALAAATRAPLLGALVARCLWFMMAYVLKIGNPKSLTVDEAAWAMQRVAARDLPAVARDAARLRAARTPLALFYAEDDAAVERAVSEELAAALGLAAEGGDRAERFGVAFAHGGHFLQKSQAGVITERLRAWRPLAGGGGGGGASE